MKTAMQELIDYMKTYFHLTDDSLEMFDKALEKEKEQIIDFGYKCRDNEKKLPQDIFNQTYNQNK